MNPIQRNICQADHRRVPLHLLVQIYRSIFIVFIIKTMATFITFSRSQNIRRSQQNLAQTEACDSGKREKTTYMPSTVSSLKKQKQNNKKKHKDLACVN